MGVNDNEHNFYAEGYIKFKNCYMFYLLETCHAINMKGRNEVLINMKGHNIIANRKGRNTKNVFCTLYIYFSLV